MFKYHRQKMRIMNFAVTDIPGVLQFLSEHPGW
ncbi:putative phage terminase large subunit domain protein, partial [Escherichia coli EC1863]